MTPNRMTSKNCAKCKKIIKNKDFLKCHSCKQKYDITCTNVSEKRFYNLMSKESKETWKCQSCRNASIKNSSPLPTTDNVTIRKKHIINVPTKNSFASLSDSEEIEDFSSLPSSSPTSKLNRSCPEIAENVNIYSKLETMNKKIIQLQEQLLSAENEIENLLSENSSLKDMLKNYSIKIDKLNHICKSNSKNPQNAKRKSLKTKLPFYQNNNQSYRDIIHTKDNLNENSITVSCNNREKSCINMQPDNSMGFSSSTLGDKSVQSL